MRRFIGIVSVLALCVGSSAMADSESIDDREVQSDFASTAEDFSNLPADEEMSPLALAFLAKWQNEFNVAVDELADAYPSQFAGAGLGDGRPWVAFKGKAPGAASTRLSALPVKVEIRANAPFTEAELASQTELLYSKLSEKYGDGIVVGPDALGTQIEVAVDSQPLATTPGGQNHDDEFAVEARATVNSIAESVGLSIPVVVNVQEVQGGMETLYGGGKLSTCTSAFVVKSRTYSNGVLTAAHCNNARAYDGRSVLQFRAEMRHGAGDAQWHSSREAGEPWFYYAHGARRQVVGAATARSGSRLCVYGRSSGTKCDKVIRTGQCANGYCGLTMTSRHQTQSGDSGGPWYAGGYAYGIHHGWTMENGYRRTLFTPIRPALKNLGVVLK